MEVKAVDFSKNLLQQLSEIDRFISVQSEENRIRTCFLNILTIM